MIRFRRFLQILAVAGVVCAAAASAVLAGAPQVQTPPFAICSAPGDQISPALAPDGTGGVLIAWIDERGGRNDIVVQHVVGPWAVDPAWPPDGLVLSSGAAERTNLRICTDGAGGAIAVWEDDSAGDARVYAQHAPASGVRDPLWPMDGLSLCEGPGDRRRPAIDFDGISGAVIAWEDRGRGENADIYAQHVKRTGERDWALGGLAVATGGVVAVRPAVVSDMAGGAIIAYQDSMPSSLNVLARHVRLVGDVDPSWPVDGLEVPGFGIWEGEVGMVSDGTGGAWIPYLHDSGMAFATGLSANHVLPSGLIAELVGVGRTRPHAGMQDPTIGPDGRGGLVGAWLEHWYEELGWEPWFIWHHDLGVSPGPTVPGSTYNGISAYSPVVVGDGEGGTIVAWLAGGGASSLYAGHVLPTGIADPACPAGGKWISGAPSGHKLLMLGGGGAYLAWQVGDAQTGWDIQGAWLAGPQPTDALASVVSAEATPECVRLVWWCASRQGAAATVYATEEGTAWTALGVVWADGQGMVRYEDRAARPGGRRGYRLGIRVERKKKYTGETRVQVPELAFALKPVRPNPAQEQAEVGFTLPRRMSVSLVLFDAGGREVRHLARGEHDAGEHTLRFATRDGAGRALSAGLYFLRLDTASGRLTTRVVVVP